MSPKHSYEHMTKKTSVSYFESPSHFGKISSRKQTSGSGILRRLWELIYHSTALLGITELHPFTLGWTKKRGCYLDFHCQYFLVSLGTKQEGWTKENGPVSLKPQCSTETHVTLPQAQSSLGPCIRCLVLSTSSLLKNNRN